jgi:ABC-type oligopeptide transport system substrate-binding subunit
MRCTQASVDRDWLIEKCACMIRTMDDQETAYDYKRYKQLLVEAVDETKRLELIEILIRESARDRLEAQRMSDRAAITAVTVAKVLGSNGRGIH